jgi:hypothetical protein
MRGYLNIPYTICCKSCIYCGARPIIALAVAEEGYVVKCPNDNNHYQTKAGLIDIEDWNYHNTSIYDSQYAFGLTATRGTGT